MKRPQAASHAVARALPLPAHAFLNAALLAAMLMMAAVLARPAAAAGYDPNYRYCVASLGVIYESADCTFNTLEQCRLAARGTGYCTENPVWRGNAIQQTRQQPARGTNAH